MRLTKVKTLRPQILAARHLSSSGLKAPTTAHPSTHTMGHSLERYLAMKIDPDIINKDWKQITILPSHLRTTPARISPIEKTGKLFNWQRPTISHQDDHLSVHCFPGSDYVYHYSSMIATYLSLQRLPSEIVRTVGPQPTDCLDVLLASNLQKLGHVDTVVVGHVHSLPSITGNEPWQDGADHDQLFAFKIRRFTNGRAVAFLGCRVSFWGSIAGSLVQALQQLSHVRQVIYLGKLGSLKAHHAPNQILATGNVTYVQGKRIEWDNILEAPALSTDPCVVSGTHYTLASVLDETHDWFAAHHQQFDWVDPEIGHMALASVTGGTEFGYLHIVSDNLAKKYPHDLSNERLKRVLQDRAALLAKTEAILGGYLCATPTI